MKMIMKIDQYRKAAKNPSANIMTSIMKPAINGVMASKMAKYQLSSIIVKQWRRGMWHGIESNGEYRGAGMKNNNGS
jgi:hypothetical protein